MRIDLPGQYDLPIQIAHQPPPAPTGNKVELAERISQGPDQVRSPAFVGALDRDSGLRPSNPQVTIRPNPAISP